MAHQSTKAQAFVTTYSPQPEIKDPEDTLPSENQPPGVDEEDNFPQSLEEALLGE